MNFRRMFASIVAILIASVPVAAQNNNGAGNTERNAEAMKKLMDSPLRKLQIAEFAITNLYVDTLNESKLVEDAINGMLKELDPHSIYTPAKEVQKLTEPLQGSFEGIGVQYNMINDTLLVIQPVTNGPSEKKGIIAGDRIVLVDDTTIAGVKMTREEIMRRLRGPKGSKVKLGIIRQGVDGIQDFIVERDKIPVHTIDASYMIEPNIGYIRISSFGATTHEEFLKAMEKLKSEGMKHLLLDLEGNGGGYMQAAVQIADEFLPKGDMIVYTDGRATGHHDYRATQGGVFENGKLVILVDEYTASAAEIVSGAVQDNDCGLVVGRRTFGKGLVQRPIDLPDGSMIRLTVAHYYTPAGRCIQKPYTKGDKKSYDKDMLDRLNKGELMSADSIHFADSLKRKTLRLGRTVYGGGGIMPDVFVPLDTMQYTKLHREMSAKSCIINTALRYVDDNRKKLKKAYKNFEAFETGFEVDSKVESALLAEVKKAKIEYNDSTWAEAIPMVKIQLKALIARDLWDMNEYFKVFNPTRDIYKKGLEIIRQEDYDKYLIKPADND
ncbi:MAG: S41 family peptidase [Bacteroidaceae bacterium]|nr:S41 family peptidase [Bacteroidaceae bacterium]